MSSFTLTIRQDGQRTVERYDSLIDAANAMAIECGGEEIDGTEFCCVGGGAEVEQDFRRLTDERGTTSIRVTVPAVDYACVLERVR